MKKFLLINLVTALYTMGLLATVFTQLVIVATPIAFLIDHSMKIDLLTFILLLFMAVGGAFAYGFSHKKIYSGFKAAWKKFHVTISFDEK